MKLNQRCEAIRLLLSDVDGVMTNGGLIFNNEGIETKVFHVRDGTGFKVWHRAGYQSGLVTARTSHVVQLRASELGIEIVRQGVQDKRAAICQIAESLGFEPQAVCYIGDDLADIAAIREVGLGVAVADAAEEVRRVADYTTSLPGGSGAVREVIEVVLKNQRRWDDLMQKFGA
ncbi:MAG: HAD hydrolase family protein [Planctomycetales bacterium]|nr:HAD hydrolase family protein [Planctomycetales bacterium]